MKTCNVVGWMALALALNACTEKAGSAADAATAPSQRGQASGAAAAPLVNSRDLARFIPDKIGEFMQQDEVEASVASVLDKQVPKALCKYEANGKTLFITISDAIGADSLRMPFTQAAGLNQESAGGYQKGKRIGAHPAIVVWETQTKRSELTMLVADRYVVKVDVRKASHDDEAEKLAIMLDIDGLAKLKPSAK